MWFLSIFLLINFIKLEETKTQSTAKIMLTGINEVKAKKENPIEGTEKNKNVNNKEEDEKSQKSEKEQKKEQIPKSYEASVRPDPTDVIILKFSINHKNEEKSDLWNEYESYTIEDKERLRIEDNTFILRLPIPNEQTKNSEYWSIKAYYNDNQYSYTQTFFRNQDGIYSMTKSGDDKMGNWIAYSLIGLGVLAFCVFLIGICRSCCKN